MRSMFRKCVLAALLLGLAALPPAAVMAQGQAPARTTDRNVIIFVADGLRYGSVTPENMPNFSRLKAEGVDFTNSHSLYPTQTTVNASAIATGHYIGDTGNFGNTIWMNKRMISLHGADLGFLESNAVLDEMNERFGGNYINETSLMAAARAAGYQTAIIGKEGPARIQDLTAKGDGSETLIVDDETGHEDGVGLPVWFSRAMRAAFFDPVMPATTQPNILQQVNQTKAVTRIVLPHFKESGKPFLMLVWSRDPDTTQHNARDSQGELSPGINSRSALAAARNADSMLGDIRAALKDQGLEESTDLFVTADHGFLTVSRTSATSPSARTVAGTITDVTPGFVAKDLALTFGLQIRNAGQTGAPLDISANPTISFGSAILGRDPAKPEIVVASNAGSDLIYLPNAETAKSRAAEIVNFLLGQDYTGAIFVNDRLGKIPGALSMSDVNLIGGAKTPAPDIFLSFRSFLNTGCAIELQCAVGVHDTTQGVGQGSHGSLSRAETRNFMAAVGPSFKTGFANPAPISNADIAPTLAQIMGVALPARGALRGRVISEALKGGAAVTATRDTIVSAPGPGGVRTILNRQSVGQTHYFDAAGIEGRVVGLTPP
jgi:predicted AlkP superfamily pyrophosphatase or phosphodiesterase